MQFTRAYHNSLDTLAQQSHHWQSLLRQAAVWATSTVQHYQQHRLRVVLFSAMCLFWASKHAERMAEMPPPSANAKLGLER